MENKEGPKTQPGLNSSAPPNTQIFKKKKKKTERYIFVYTATSRFKSFLILQVPFASIQPMNMTVKYFFFWVIDFSLNSEKSQRSLFLFLD